MTAPGSQDPAESLERYLVGGAVRDELLGLAVKDRDYVVIGSTAEDMIAAGFKPVGRDFPVFLHPTTKEEYALARTERKTARGYHGFTFHADPNVTLEEDLQRRDLTINAMARDPSGAVIDPFGGQADLHQKTLRHVSPAFAEDPVRVLRIARFAARFAPLGFRVAEETQALMRDMVASGEVDALVAERVWQEVRAALDEPQPSAFFECLRRCGALARLLPELDRLWGVPQTAKYHPEIDTGVHAMMALDVAAAHGMDNIVRYAVLVHDLGKGITPAHVLPSHRGHDEAGVPLVEAVSKRWRVPAEYREVAVAVARWHLRSHRVLEMTARKVLKLLQGVDALRRPQRLDWFIQACLADVRGRLARAQTPYPQGDFLLAAADAARGVDTEGLRARGLAGPALGEAIRRERIKAIDALEKPG